MRSDPARPHPLASLRAAPVLADAAGRRETRGRAGRSAVLHHRTASLQHSNVTRKKTRHFLKGRGRRGSESTVLPHAEARQDGGEHAPRSNLCPGRGLGRGDKRPGEVWPRPLAALAEQLLSTFASYRYTCASALPKAAFCNHCQTNRNKELSSHSSRSTDSNENTAF